ncbi:hypothetical protein KC614_00995 [candidate division WWE3 bacterium]|uniref:Uncharacterized protein n=1 Tax=candidate division WWE3 bacterium TaxID=2053526 RepID=A0A955RRS8_UNCKA|nr:hypothetical protein [candidate division WWE3 bacterium]
MAFTRIVPLTKEAETITRILAHEIQQVVREAVTICWDAPPADIITVIEECRVVVADPIARELNSHPEVLVLIFTSDEDKRPRVQDLVDRIASRFPVGLKAEIWVTIFDGWGLNFDL